MAEGVEVESFNSRYYCHHCSHEIALCRPTELVCPDCSGSFIEEITKSLNIGFDIQDDDDDQYVTDDDDDVDDLPFPMSSMLNRMLLDLQPPSTPPGVDSANTTEHGSSTEHSETEEVSFERLLHQLDLTGRLTGGLTDLVNDMATVQFMMSEYLEEDRDSEYDAIASQLLDEVEMSGPPPLTREQIQSLPKETLTTQHTDQRSCTVCMDEFCATEVVIFLPCTHVYHDRCITPWLQRQATCPNCREVIHLGVDGPSSQGH